MTIKITGLAVRDVRFPTSQTLAGSDAMNKDPDYSAAYLTLQTDAPDGLYGNGLVFTLGRGTELCVGAMRALSPLVVGRELDALTANMGTFWKDLMSDTQLRWLGPEKGVVHMAAGAIINAVWDMWAKKEGKPLWRLISDLTPEELVDCLDFTYITDAITKDEALAILRANAPTRLQRIAKLEKDGYPAYTTSVGWLGYEDEKLRQLCQQAIAGGWDNVKVKVGGDIDDDIRRCRIVREEIGPDRKLMLDANQVWDVDEAIANIQRLAQFTPWWIEEPTSPDDILGHARIAAAVAPIGIATGEVCQNRVTFKQLLQANAISFCQIDSVRLAGVNEVLAVMLMSAKFGVPVCPHAGGVGLSEHVQHLAMIDYVCISASMERRVAEYVDNLHEHFVNPVAIRNGRYVAPVAPGYGLEMKADSLDKYEFIAG